METTKVVKEEFPGGGGPGGPNGSVKLSGTTTSPPRPAPVQSPVSKVDSAPISRVRRKGRRQHLPQSESLRGIGLSMAMDTHEGLPWMPGHVENGTGARVSSRSPQAASPDGANNAGSTAGTTTGAGVGTTASSTGPTSTSPPPAPNSQQPRSPDGPTSPQSASALAAAARIAASPRSHVNGCSPGPDNTQGAVSPSTLALALTSGGAPATPAAASAAAAATPAAAAAAAAAASARSLAKMKRFLSTLVQFGCDISREAGDRVRALVFSLVAGAITLDEFHAALQEATNFPLRGFVLPFLRAQLPSLQREVLTLARNAGESVVKFLRHHEHVLLDSNFPPAEALDIFHADPSVCHAAKRRSSYDSFDDGDDPETAAPWPKRAAVVATGAGGWPSSVGTLQRRRHIPPPPNLQHPGAQAAKPTGNSAVAASDDEWRNINVMLSCVLSMVEKTKHALAILQQRSTAGNSNSAVSGSANPGAPELQENGVGVNAAMCSRQVKAAVDEIIARTLQDTDERIAELKRRAEDAVNEVRRQAVLEIQRAVAAAESQASELVAAERANLERRLAGGATGFTVGSGSTGGHSPTGSQPSTSCWNCGRKAHETCSGCNTARYCGAFCQHKDWEAHHAVCGVGVGGGSAAGALTQSTVSGQTLGPLAAVTLSKTSPHKARRFMAELSSVNFNLP